MFGTAWCVMDSAHRWGVPPLFPDAERYNDQARDDPARDSPQAAEGYVERTPIVLFRVISIKKAFFRRTTESAGDGSN
jgi:hypothetical protein